MLNAETLFQAATHAKNLSKDGRILTIRVDHPGLQTYRYRCYPQGAEDGNAPGSL